MVNDDGTLRQSPIVEIAKIIGGDGASPWARTPPRVLAHGRGHGIRCGVSVRGATANSGRPVNEAGHLRPKHRNIGVNARQHRNLIITDIPGKAINHQVIDIARHEVVGGQNTSGKRGYLWQTIGISNKVLAVNRFENDRLQAIAQNTAIHLNQQHDIWSTGRKTNPLVVVNYAVLANKAKARRNGVGRGIEDRAGLKAIQVGPTQDGSDVTIKTWLTVLGFRPQPEEAKHKWE